MLTCRFSLIFRIYSRYTVESKNCSNHKITDEQSNTNAGHLSKLKSLNHGISNTQGSTFSDGVSGKLSSDIIHGNSAKIPPNGNKRIRQLVNPSMPHTIANSLTSAVGIHLSPLGISWARISKQGNKLTNMSFLGFSALPKKMHLTESFDLAINIMPRIPPADIYVFESSPTLSPQGQTQTATVTSHNQQIELNCMMLSLLNTSVNHNVTLKNNTENTTSIENRVFYLRSKVPARLFRTLVGTERVSAIDIVKDLLENRCCAPCTPIQVDSQIRAAFMSQLPANKELLAQAVMLVISFMDLCIYKNGVSLGALAPNRKLNR